MLQQNLPQEDCLSLIGIKPQSQYGAMINIKMTWHRWIALTFASIVQVGSFLCHDFPSNLDAQIQQKYGGLGVSDADVNLLYTVYQIPNIVLPFLSGNLTNIFGARKCLFIFGTLLVIGQGICTIGVHKSFRSFEIVVAGRCLFGLGGGSLAIAQNTIVSQWFKNKDLSYAFGVTTSVSCIGSILSSFIFSATYYISNDLFLPLLIGTITCIISWFSGICLNAMDRYSEKQERNEDIIVREEDKMKIEDIKDLKSNYWWICASCAFTYISFYPFMQTLQNYLILQFGLPKQTACNQLLEVQFILEFQLLFLRLRFTNSLFLFLANYLSIPFITSIGITPIAGLFIDKFGKRGIILIGTSIFLVVSHYLMIAVPQCRNQNDSQCASYWFILPLVLIGLVYSIYTAALFPCIPIVCEPKIEATAFGITYSITSLGLAIISIATGEMIQSTKKDNGYFWVQIFFISTSLLSVGINFIIYLIDMETGYRLNKSIKQLAEEVETLNECKQP